MSKRSIIGVGEILWDLFPDRSCFGGAPANFACAAAGMASDQYEVSLFSGVGDDELGRRAIDQLNLHQVKTDLVQQTEHPTGTVEIKLQGDGSAEYRFADNVAWDNLTPKDDDQINQLRSAAENAAAVCFGTLAQRSLASSRSIMEFVQATPADAIRLFDINLRFPHVSNSAILQSLKVATHLKLNETELPYLADLLDLENDDQHETLAEIYKRFNLQGIAFTQGSNGATLVDDVQFARCPPMEVEVVDTVGAGDAFTAAWLLGILENLATERISVIASFAGAFVCEHAGATPEFPQELKDSLNGNA